MQVQSKRNHAEAHMAARVEAGDAEGETLTREYWEGELFEDCSRCKLVAVRQAWQ